ncbi:MAG: phosphoribosylpyrophosphate synthetase [Chitinophagales bacterium]
MESEYNYDTVSEAVNDLQNRGYTSDFNLNHDVDFIICNKTSVSLSPEDFDIDEVYRFEGEIDPGDETIVYAISSVRFNIKGIIVNAYGMYADNTASRIVKYLDARAKTK